MRLACCDETQHPEGRITTEVEGRPYYRLQAVRHLIGIHAVSAAVRAATTDNRRIERLIVARGARSSRLQGLIDACRYLGIPVRFEPRSALRRLAGDEAHQNVVAIVAAAPYATLESVLEAAGDRSLIVALDTVQDPRNLEPSCARRTVPAQTL